MEARNTITQSLPAEDLYQVVWLQRISAHLASAFFVLRAAISWIFELGISSEMSFYQKKNLALINRVSFISLLLALPGTFLLILMGFSHSFILMAGGLLSSFLVLSLNCARKVEWAQAVFAISPAGIILSYTLYELAIGGMQDHLTFILARQGLCFTLLIPVIIYSFDKSLRGKILGVCVLALLAFDVISLNLGSALIESTIGVSLGFFSVLSVLQLVGLSACILYLQDYTMKHDLKVRQSNEKLHSMVIRDGMTGLFNHTFMEQLIGDAINRSNRSNTPLSLLMIDLDFFKQINDSFGHNTGDEVLVHLAKLLTGSKRSTDYLGRWGGDELILLLTDTSLQGAARVAEKLRDLVSSHTFPRRIHLTISLGASEYQARDNLAGFIQRADTALYRAKHLGRNRVEVEKSTN